MDLQSLKANAGDDVDTVLIPSSNGSWGSNGRQHDELREIYRDHAYKNSIVPEDLPKQFLPGPNVLRQIQVGFKIRNVTNNTKKSTPITFTVDKKETREKENVAFIPLTSLDSNTSVTLDREACNGDLLDIKDVSLPSPVIEKSKENGLYMTQKDIKRETKNCNKAIKVASATGQVTTKSGADIAPLFNKSIRSEQTEANEAMEIKSHLSQVSKESIGIKSVDEGIDVKNDLKF